jgi:hypothetical protein
MEPSHQVFDVDAVPDRVMRERLGQEEVGRGPDVWLTSVHDLSR